jgi:flagellar biogenesis protein FliO
MATRLWLVLLGLILAPQRLGWAEEPAPSPPKVAPSKSAITDPPRTKSLTESRLARATTNGSDAEPSVDPLFSTQGPATVANQPPAETTSESTLLLPTKRGPRRESRPRDATAPLEGWPSLGNVAGSLGIVLGVFFALVWGLRRFSPRTGGQLPKEAFEVLGRAPLVGRRQAQLIRCGSKLLLVSIAADQIETLTEITDPADVDRLAGLCLQSHSTSASSAFRGVFEQFAKEPARGFLGGGQPDPFEALRRGTGAPGRREIGNA